MDIRLGILKVFVYNFSQANSPLLVPKIPAHKQKVVGQANMDAY